MGEVNSAVIAKPWVWNAEEGAVNSCLSTVYFRNIPKCQGGSEGEQ